jgi:hypothetical protein
LLIQSNYEALLFRYDYASCIFTGVTIIKTA